MNDGRSGCTCPGCLQDAVLEIQNLKTNLSRCNHSVCGFDGLTKREYFAAMAMQGLMSTSPRELLSCCSKEIVGEYVAKQSVAMADLLIAELNK